MSEVIINFKSEELEGVVAVGTYLIDAAKRLGVKVDCDYYDEENETEGYCIMKVSKGKALLSSPTKLEMELLSATARKNGERLACQTKIEKPGEVTIMSVKSNETEEEKKVTEEEKQEKQKEEYKKQFEDLPLEKKISSLLELEAIALNETFSFVMNSPYAAVSKVMDVMAGFGLKMEQEETEAKRPDEHTENGKGDAEKEEKTEEKKSSATDKKKTASKSTRSRKSTTTRKKTTAKKPAAKKTTTRKRTTRKTTAKKKEEDKE